MSSPIECYACNIPHTEPKNKKNVKIYRLTEENTEITVSKKGRSKVKRCYNVRPGTHRLHKVERGV